MGQTDRQTDRVGQWKDEASGSAVPWALQSPVWRPVGEEWGLSEQGWVTLTSGDGGGDVDLGDSERCEGEELVRATGWD